MRPSRLLISLVVPVVVLLAACDDPAPPAETPEPPPQEAATPASQGLAGIWRPVVDRDLEALVLEDGGSLYLVNGGERRGLRWHETEQGDARLHYLDDGGRIIDETLPATLDDTALTLAGESPLAGEYRRDPTQIGTVEGRVTLPEDAAIPANGVLVLTLRDASVADAAPLAQRLGRLALEGNLSMPFRLYFDQRRVEPTRHYALDARVLAEGTTLFATPVPRQALNGGESPLTLPLRPTGASAGLTDTYWKLVRVGGQPTPAPQEQNRQAHIVFHGGQNEVRGNSGCNELNGRYQTDGERLTLENLISTEMACADDDVADDFIDALNRTRRFQVEGQRLDLYDDQGAPLAVLRAEYLY